MRSVFERYNIVIDRDLRLATEKQQEYLNSQMVTKTGTLLNFDPTKRKGGNFVSSRLSLI